jgi:hypothetical protein
MIGNSSTRWRNYEVILNYGNRPFQSILWCVPKGDQLLSVFKASPYGEMGDETAALAI